MNVFKVDFSFVYIEVLLLFYLKTVLKKQKQKNIINDEN